MRGNAIRKSSTPASIAIWAVAVLAALLVAVPAEASRSCTTAIIEEPFRLPDQSLYPGGRLTLCSEREYSPVASLYEVRVDGMGIGLFVSRREVSQGLGDAWQPFVVFHRRDQGELRLVGFGDPQRDRMEYHLFGIGIGKSSIDVANLFTPSDDDTSMLIVQARVD